MVTPDFSILFRSSASIGFGVLGIGFPFEVCGESSAARRRQLAGGPEEIVNQAATAT